MERRTRLRKLLDYEEESLRATQKRLRFLKRIYTGLNPEEKWKMETAELHLSIARGLLKGIHRPKRR